MLRIHVAAKGFHLRTHVYVALSVFLFVTKNANKQEANEKGKKIPECKSNHGRESRIG